MTFDEALQKDTWGPTLEPQRVPEDVYYKRGVDVALHLLQTQNLEVLKNHPDPDKVVWSTPPPVGYGNGTHTWTASNFTRSWKNEAAAKQKQKQKQQQPPASPQ